MQNRLEDFSSWARWAAIGSAATAMVSVAVSQSLLGIALALLLISRKRWSAPPGFLWFALFTAWTVLSLFAGGDPAGGLPQIRKFYVWLLLFVLVTVLRGVDDFRILMLAWLALGSAGAVRGLWQFSVKWHAAATAGVDFYQSYVGDRITGFMSHWMTFSSQMMVALLCGLALVLFAPMDPKQRRYVAFFGLPVIAAALVLGFTRGIWLAAAAAVVYLAWNWRRWSVVALPIGLAVLMLAGPAGVRERMTSLFRPRGQTDSNLHRVVTWRTGVEIIKTHPLLGVGPEQVGKRFNEYVPPDIARPLPEGWYGHLHNIYLQYSAERGIPAACFLVLFLLAQVRFWLDGLRRGAMPRWVFHSSMAILIGMMITGLFEHNLGDSEVLALLLGALGGAARAAAARTPDGPAQRLDLNPAQ
jgi:O-antigen ligase